MKLNLTQKVLSGFIACSIMITAAVFFTVRNNAKYVDTMRWVSHTHSVLTEMERMIALYGDAEGSVRGYVITGGDEFLTSYQATKSSIYAQLNKLRTVTNDNTTQQLNIEVLDHQLGESIKYFDQLISLREDDYEQAAAIVASGRGKRLGDAMRAAVANATSLENNLLTERSRNSELEADRYNAVFITLLAIIGIVLMAVFIVISSNLRALKKAENETADRNWMLTGNFELNEKTRGDLTELEISQAIITQLCHYAGAQIGALYLHDNGLLHLAGSYAFDYGRQAPVVIKPGEGLVGQVAQDRALMLVDNVPENYIRIGSSTGNVTPRHLILLPLVQDDVLRGVIELGTTHRLSPLHIEFLDKIRENVAIVVGMAQSRRKLRELLEETQRQAEELETQQEELRQSNEELHEKTELLERSEATLKVQQEELQQTNEELEEKANLLEEQKEKLENAKDEVETKARELELTSKYKSEFLANMSHELRTPLNSVLILAQLLSENRNGTLTPKEVDFAKNICSSGTDLLDLINEILDLSKVEAGKMELDIAPFRLAELIDDMSSMFSEVARTRAIKLTFNYDAATMPASIVTDSQRLEQILRNLLSNAFKFTAKDGSVTMSVTRADKNAVTFRNNRLYSAAEVLAIAVADTGIGIPEDKTAIIFEAFQQADGSTKRKYGGTGLGLSISRELANALGGEIHLQSKEGAGSTFTLYLPVQYDAGIMLPAERNVEVRPAAAVPARPARGAMPAAPIEGMDDRQDIGEEDKVILIMEDDREFAQVLLGFVRERNYKGIIAYEGNTGLSCARHYHPDAIILDMKLPVMDGTDVLKILKKDPTLRHIPVQIISGYDMKKEGMALGAFDYIQKPISGTDLRGAFDKIEDFISKKLKKLLIIEDNEVQNNAIRELIGNGDVKCYSAFSGAQAYEMMVNDSFDCIIVDLGLPDMTGYELMQKIKDNAQLRKTPVIVYTGKDLGREETDMLNKLASTVVLKTVNSKERLLDETTLFLHRVESRLPREKQNIIRKLHKTDEVLRDKTVLIVDDDVRNIYSIVNALEEQGMNCITAANGRNALEVLEQNSDTGIVLMDVMMPEMDGYDATREIRALPRYARLPVIGLTAKAMKGDREKCLNAGMSDYISKPVNVEQLLSLMRVWLYR